MPNSRRWKQSGARRGWAVHEDLQQEAWLRVLQGRRSPEMASRTFPTTWSDWEWSCERQGNPSQHNAKSAGLRPFVEANIKKLEASDRVQKLQQALDILGDTEGPEVDGFARSIEARRDRRRVCPSTSR